MDVSVRLNYNECGYNEGDAKKYIDSNSSNRSSNDDSNYYTKIVIEIIVMKEYVL